MVAITVIGVREFDVVEICSASQSGLRGEFVKYRSGCDDLDVYYEVKNDLSAGDERVVRGADDDGSYDEVSLGGLVALLG